ncbi:MAG: MBL fold metallo-hydrolase [Anaerolineae bacterium]|nr:MBL fold metallo-hydrolase [Gemmatimonadaceae bacterium]
MNSTGESGIGNRESVGRWRESLVVVAAASLLLGCGSTGKYILLGTAAVGTAGTVFGRSSAYTRLVQQPDDPVYPSRAFVTPEVFKSMIYMARTDSGVIIIDLGWSDADDVLQQNLGKLRFRPDPSNPDSVKSATVKDIHGVFLTHSHYDHIQGWRTVSQRRERFGWHEDTAYQRSIYLAASETSYLLNEAEFSGVVPKTTDYLITGGSFTARLGLYRDRPRKGQVKTKPFSTDTSFILGRDTLYALTVPGHTQGSTAYIFRHVMFVGDALTSGTPLLLIPMPSWMLWDWGRMRRGSWRYADNVRQNRESVRALHDKVARLPLQARPRLGCIAHAICHRMQTEDEWKRFWEVAVRE